MKFNFQHFLRALILLGFAGFIFKLHYTGDIVKYINPEYVFFSKIAAILLVSLFFLQWDNIWKKNETHQGDECDHGHGCGHDHGFSSKWSIKALISYVILVIPLAGGLVLPVNTLGAEIASKKGLMLTATDKGISNTQETNSEFIDDLLDQPIIQMTYDKFVFNTDIIMGHADKLKGKPIEITGFVYKDEVMNSNELFVSRFVVNHCVADAGVINLLASVEDAHQIEQDTWIEIRGVLDIGKYNDMNIPIINVSNWKTVDEPADPYVYP
ncbi:TIGR03943 family protein [Bacillus sp. V3B]|uniref:TIGR03943 family putative permease subunit n=1 Tax=Bacillus sp. V3B TaxID=2804915 RepID=UPI00210D4A4A|nr:TIGR03943 family protein [Bacillus sp. V3B]MCQ6276746.1 TIGR03943 family protein [Bacillus sp. V3B]